MPEVPLDEAEQDGPAEIRGKGAEPSRQGTTRAKNAKRRGLFLLLFVLLSFVFLPLVLAEVVIVGLFVGVVAGGGVLGVVGRIVTGGGSGSGGGVVVVNVVAIHVVADVRGGDGGVVAAGNNLLLLLIHHWCLSDCLLLTRGLVLRAACPRLQRPPGRYCRPQ